MSEKAAKVHFLDWGRISRDERFEAGIGNVDVCADLYHAGHYQHVCTVSERDPDPDAVFVICNTIDNPWFTHPRVLLTACGQHSVDTAGGLRSMSVGDVVEVSDGRLLLVARIGFVPLPVSQYPHKKALGTGDAHVR